MVNDQEVRVGGNAEISKHSVIEIALSNLAGLDTVADVLLSDAGNSVGRRWSEKVNLYVVGA